jgi:hypothetical protein
MRLSVVETGWFVLSVAVLAFLYGVAVGAWKWPPCAWIARATGQAEAAYRAAQGNPLRSEIHGAHLRPNGDLLVSLRTPSLVFVVDPTSLEVKWTASTPFLHQHDPGFVGDGWIGVFDNNQDPTPRGTMMGGSRIVALSPSADSTKTLPPTARSGPLYTTTTGHWQTLDNGNSLLTEARADRGVEAAPSGRTVWEWIHPPCDDARVPFVMNGARHDLTRADVADWACASAGSTAARAPTPSSSAPIPSLRSHEVRVDPPSPFRSASSRA